MLFLTARDAVSDRVRGLDAGADDYLAKPFAFEELLARVRALVRRQDLGDGTVVSFRDVRADLATGRAERNGHALSLTAKEHSLLVFFLRHSGQVLSRTRIYEHVWDERYDGFSNTLEVHVKELRRKLEAHGDRLDSHVAGARLLAGRDARSARGRRQNEPGGAGVRVFSGDAGRGAGRGVGDACTCWRVRTCTGTWTSGWGLSLDSIATSVEVDPGRVEWKPGAGTRLVLVQPGDEPVFWVVTDHLGTMVDHTWDVGGRGPGEAGEAGADDGALARNAHGWQGTAMAGGADGACTRARSRARRMGGRTGSAE